MLEQHSSELGSEHNHISLHFQGMWLEPDGGIVPAERRATHADAIFRPRPDIVPNESGVYTVYACKPKRDADSVTVRELLYIGESGAVRDRVMEHMSSSTGSDWKKHLRPGEVLCFAFAPVSATVRERAQSALINWHKPPENREHEHARSFPSRWSPTSVRTFKGRRCARLLLSHQLTVRSA